MVGGGAGELRPHEVAAEGTDVVERCRARVAHPLAPRAIPGELEHGVPVLLGQVIESTANAGRRCASGTIAAIDCRTTENNGTPSVPATSAHTTSAGYGSTGATDQKTTSVHTPRASTGRNPNRSMSRPSSGARLA